MSNYKIALMGVTAGFMLAAVLFNKAVEAREHPFVFLYGVAAGVFALLLGEHLGRRRRG